MFVFGDDALKRTLAEKAMASIPVPDLCVPLSVSAKNTPDFNPYCSATGRRSFTHDVSAIKTAPMM
jgi:hypothetical protein